MCIKKGVDVFAFPTASTSALSPLLGNSSQPTTVLLLEGLKPTGAAPGRPEQGGAWTGLSRGPLATAQAAVQRERWRGCSPSVASFSSSCPRLSTLLMTRPYLCHLLSFLSPEAKLWNLESNHG